MKKILSVSMGALLLAASLTASAWWGNDGWGRGGGYNDWPIFTPMYWMEEMADSWDDDYYDDYYYGGPGYYGGPYGGYGPGYGYGAPYGGGYGAPYGGGYGAPYGGGYGAPYGGYPPAYPAAPAPAPVQ